ncbi:MAG: hypothetical protein HY314_06340 [Acidobacteria bacterium]|nr:hypothetical protein [Acidobacteriota bacterium]
MVARFFLTVATPLQAERLPIKVYTTADGLAQNFVNRIVRDSRGFLWFCTEDGLSRYDGYTFTNYGPEQGLTLGSTICWRRAKANTGWPRAVAYAGSIPPKGPGTKDGRPAHSARSPVSGLPPSRRCSRSFIPVRTSGPDSSQRSCRIVQAPSGVGHSAVSSEWSEPAVTLG